MTVAQGRSKLASIAPQIFEVVGEAHAATNSDRAPLIASSGLPTGDLAEALDAQMKELEGLRIRLLAMLAKYSTGQCTRDDIENLRTDLELVLKAIRLAVYDLIENGVTAGGKMEDLFAQAKRYTGLDAVLRTEILPQLAVEISAAA